MAYIADTFYIKRDPDLEEMREKLLHAASIIHDSFDWTDSKQGADYWYGVYDNLCNVADQIGEQNDIGEDENI